MSLRAPLPRPRVLALIAGLLLQVAATAAELPTPVPVDQLDAVPYRHTGLLRTASVGPDPTVLGSGWVASERVVASAAHVFFVDETLGWNRNSWSWLRAAKPDEFWDTSRMTPTRTFRVLAGYAEAAARDARAGPNSEKILDAFNRDNLALIFYRDVSPHPAPPRRIDSLLGSGTYTMVGYPADLGSTEVNEIRMYAHLGGRPATFTPYPPSSDFQGHPFVIGATGDIATGPGGSGGPTLKQIDGQWTVVGTLVGGASDFSKAIVRGLDSEFDTMLNDAADDAVAPGSGALLWEVPGSLQNVVVFRRDGSFITTSEGRITAYDATGVQRWRRSSSDVFPSTMAETPDGRIVALDIYKLVVIEPTTGTEIARHEVPYSNGLAIGEIGEAYASGPEQVTRVSPQGVVDWTYRFPFEPGTTTRRTNPAIGTDGTVYVVSHDRIHALAGSDGTLRWRTDPLSGVRPQTLTPRPDGSILIGTSTAILCYEPDGTLRWQQAANGALTEEIHVGQDGRIVLPLAIPRNGYVRFDADGSNRQEVLTDHVVNHLARDANGTVYASGFSGMTAYAVDGSRKWTQPTVAGPVLLGPANQLLTYSGNRYDTIAVLTTDGTAAALDWQAGRGGFNNARRVANTAPIAPRLVTAPVDTRVVIGQRLELSVTAEGSFPLTFEWRRDGRLITDQVGQRLLLRNADQSVAGSYTVTVRNAAGTATSAPVTVTVGAAAFGDLLWSSPIEPLHPPAIGDDGLVYVCSLIREDPGAPFKPTLIALSATGDERWRRDLSASSGTTAATYPIIGDDGRIYIVLPGNVWAWSAAGDLLWHYEFTPTNYATDDNIDIALARDNGLFFRSGGIVAALSPAGELRWSHEAPYDHDWKKLLVRRDGLLSHGTGRLIAANGAKLAVGDGVPAGDQYLLGPDDEWFLDNRVIDRNGRVIARNPSVNSFLPQLIMLDGTLLNDSFNLFPFMGGTIETVTTGSSGRPAAVLEGDRILWVDDFDLLTLYDRTGQKLAETSATFGRKVAVSRTGVLFAGPHLSAYHTGFNLADSAWPVPHADSRNTGRAPTSFTLAPTAPTDARILARSDPRGLYPPYVTYGAEPLETYVGYSAFLAASIDGSGPFVYQWTKDGQPINRADAETGELHFTAFHAADAGSYRVSATNPAGTVTSAAFNVTVRPPSPITTGTHVRQIQPTNNNPPFTAVYTLNADRTIELTLFAGRESHSAGRILPSGRFLTDGYNGVSGNITGSEIELDLAGTGAAPASPVTGRTSGNLPAGVYRGHSTGAVGYPVTLVLYADGTYEYFNAHHRFKVGAGAFTGTSRSSRLAIQQFADTFEIDLRATESGAIVGTATTTAAIPALTTVTGFVALHPDRAPIERLSNIATLGAMADGAEAMVAGFVVEGSQPGNLLLRAIGPGLQEFGHTQTLHQPRLTLVPLGGAAVASGGAWHDAADADAIRTSGLRLGAFPLGNNVDDAALLVSLSRGAYTAGVSDDGAAQGNVLVEVYEDRAASPGSDLRLRNLSTRGSVNGVGRILTGGFVIEGEVPKSILVRAIGPGLLPYTGGAFTPASDPTIKVFRSGETEPLAVVDDYWTTGVEEEINAAAARVGAFALAQGSNDAATVLALPPGGYSVQVANLADETGIVLLEIYELPSR